MIRKLALAFTALAALSLAVLTPAASAQTATPTPAPCSYANYIANSCQGTAGGYPENGFAPIKPQTTPTPNPTSTPAPTATATPASGADDSDAIAFTGAESRVLGYVGAGLIGFGAIALATARRKTSDEQ